MTVQMVSFRAAPGDIADVQAGIARLFAAVADARPANTRYVAVQLADGETFALVLDLADGAANPLLGIDEAITFRERIAQWNGAPVSPQPVTVLGAYGIEM